MRGKITEKVFRYFLLNNLIYTAKFFNVVKKLQREKIVGETLALSTRKRIGLKVEICQNIIISGNTHHKSFVEFCKWIENKGFRNFSDLVEQLPVLEIPAQVTLIQNQQSFWG